MRYLGFTFVLYQVLLLYCLLQNYYIQMPSPSVEKQGIVSLVVLTAGLMWLQLFSMVLP